MSKKGAVTLLFVLALAVAFSGQAFAAMWLNVGAASTNTVDSQKAGATNVVLTAFTAQESNAGADNITAFTVDNAAGASGLGTELAKLSIYRDVNEDGKFNSGDTLVAGATTTTTTDFDAAGLVVTLTPTSPETFAQNGSRKYLVVADLSRANGGIVDNHTFGVLVGATATSGAAVVNPGGGFSLTQAAKTLNLMATHLRFVSAGIAKQVATNGELLIDAQNLLAAVDDFGNVDVDFTESVTFASVDYSTLGSTTTNLTATADAGGATNAKTTAIPMVGGLLANDTSGGAAGSMFSLKHLTAGPVTVVATSFTKKLEGSITVCNDAYPATVPVVNPARGIEVYDVDHNGKIDHVTIFFDTPVDPNGVVNGNFTVAGGYTLTGNPANLYDAGGVGIRNAGEYGITLTLNEKADVYDTNAKPDITYNVANKINSKGNVAVFVQAFGSAQAIEVDRARPILISAQTKDAGIGAGTTTNGILDGIVFTFSEPVRNVTAGAATSDATAYIGLAIPVGFGMSFNQGNGSGIGTNVVTIPVSETTINTGVTPTITYNEDNASARITDFATSATGANSYNSYYALNSEFARVETSIQTVDGAPMVVHSVETLDLNNNGRIDNIRVTFSENTIATSFVGVDFYTSVAAFASGLNANGIYTPTAIAGTTTPTLTFTITEVGVAGVYDTEATPSFRYDPTMIGSTITDGVGNELSAYGPGGLSHAATKDLAAPVIVKISTGDAYADTAYVGDSGFEAEGANGRLDKVTLTFSEKVQSGEGAQLGGTALDHAIGQFTINHALLAGRTKIATTAAIGKPTWTDTDANGDNKTDVVVTFQELPQGTAGMVNGGDTGSAVTVLYAASGTSSYNIKDYAADPNLVYTTLPASTDGAAPFIVNGIGNTWNANAFANVLTYDKPEDLPGTPARAAGNNGKGNGRLEGFILKFTENVNFSAVAGTPLARFTTTLVNGGVLTFNNAGASVAGSGTNTITLVGARTTAGGYDTGTTPALTYAPTSALTIRDAALNDLPAFAAKPSYDAAPPAVVGVNGDTAAANKLNFTFSEPVFAHDADGKSISFNAAAISSSVLFGYDNLGAGPGSSGFTAAAVTQPSSNVLQATMNSNLTVVDIENDLVWVKAASIFDDADVVETGLADNTVPSAVAGATIKLWIMDDVIAPWIIGAETVDYNKNGKIDHIKFTFSEPIIDASLKGYVSANAMSANVAATWIVSGYTGPAYWNLFAGTADAAGNTGKAAAIAAGKPAFAGNAANDAVLYLELDENLVPANANSGVGSTGFKPTVTWGIGADAETLGDARPNLLNTNASTSAPTNATNGTVADKVGPAIVGATISGQNLTVLFSEPVKTMGDVKYAEYFLVDGASNKIWGLSWTNNSTVVLTMKSDYAFSASAATTVQVNPVGNPDLTDLGDTQSPQNPAGLAADVVEAMWDVASPAAQTPYPASTATRGAFKVTNNVWIAADGISDASPSANEAVTIKWTYSQIDSVDVYVSFNGGESYELLPGSRTAASAKQFVWSGKLGVTNVKVQSSAGGANFVYAVTPVYDGNVVGGSVGAPSALTIADVPGDNGGFVIAKFKVSADNLTAVNSYLFYRQMVLGTADTTWVLWATVPAGAADAAGKMAVIVPTANNKTSKWAVRATTTKVVSNQVVASKEAEVPVAEVVFVEGAVSKEAVDVVSAMSEVVEAASVDNIAPSAISTISASSAGSGVQITWVAPADHGIVASYTLAGTTGFIYGVDKYEVYRKTGTGEFALVGTAPKGSTSYVDNVAAGATVYQYMVKAMDSAFTVQTNVPGNAMSLSGVTCDLNGDRTVGLGDLVLLGSNWDVKSTDAKFIAAFDFNKDGAIGLGDLVLLGNAWTPASKVAKAAPAAGVAFDLNAEYNADNSTYFVTVSPKDVSGINGIGFSMKYDAEKYEFVSESVSGLSGDVKIVKADQGIVDIASFYGSDKFNGSVVLGFKAKGQISEMNIEMVNASVAINSEISAVNNSTVTLKAVPTVYSLSQNFPNPFNPTTTIEYSIPKAGNATLAIYNIAGQKVRTLVNENQAAAFYKVVWDGRNDNGESVATGMYFYKLVSGNYSKIVKMTLMK